MLKALEFLHGFLYSYMFSLTFYKDFPLKGM